MSFPLFVELGLQHFVHLVLLRRNGATLIALGAIAVRAFPPAAGCRWRCFQVGVVFRIDVSVLAASGSPFVARAFVARTVVPCTLVAGRFVALPTAPPTATPTRATIFATFTFARWTTANGFVSLLIVQGPRVGWEFVRERLVRECFIAGVDVAQVAAGSLCPRIHIAGVNVTGVDIARIYITRIDIPFAAFAGGFVRAATATATATTAAAVLAPFAIIGGTIEAQPFFAGWSIGLTSHKIFRFEDFRIKDLGGWFGMRFWRPIFDETIAKTTAWGVAFPARRTTLFLTAWRFFTARLAIWRTFAARSALTATIRGTLGASLAIRSSFAFWTAVATITSTAAVAISFAAATAIAFATFARRICGTDFRFGASRRSEQIRRQIVVRGSNLLFATNNGSGGSSLRSHGSRWWRSGLRLGFRFGLRNRQAQHAGELAPVAGRLGWFLGGRFGRLSSRRWRSCRRWLYRGTGCSGSGLDRRGGSGFFRRSFLRCGGRQPDRFEQRGPVIFSW